MANQININRPTTRIVIISVILAILPEIEPRKLFASK